MCVTVCVTLSEEATVLHSELDSLVLFLATNREMCFSSTCLIYVLAFAAWLSISNSRLCLPGCVVVWLAVSLLVLCVTTSSSSSLSFNCVFTFLYLVYDSVINNNDK